MVDIDATAVIAPLFFILIFQLLRQLNEIPLLQGSNESKQFEYEGQFTLTAKVIKHIPGPHWILPGHGPHKILFTVIDISILSLLLVVVYELHISSSLTTGVFAVALMIFVLIYPLITWKQYWEILEGGIIPMSYAIYFFYTIVLFPIISRPEFLYTLFEGNDTAFLALFQPLTTIVFETHPPLPDINRISYIRSRIDILLIYIAAFLMWRLRIVVLYATVPQELEKVRTRSNMNPRNIGYE